MNKSLQCFGRWLLLVLLTGLPLHMQAQSLAAVYPVNDDQGDQQTQGKSLVRVLEEISEKYDVNFFFEKEKIKHKLVGNQHISVTELEELLQQILTPLDLASQKLDHKTYIIEEAQSQQKSIPKVEKSKLESTTGALRYFYKGSVANLESNRVQAFLFQLQEKTINGTVTDLETGESLPGVNVVVKGTSNGTITDIEGNYRLTVADDAQILVFSSVGYTTEEITIGNQSTINVQLAPDIKALSEVVVVGYGTQERAKVTGAISSVSGEEIDAMPVPSLDAALQGRAAGVNVTNSGSPGVNPQVRIRGIGTIGNNNPLYVIDGMPAGGLNAINPNDIESIEILKDAATAAIYGSRASNGVIMVTTKKGTAGDVKVNLDSYYGVQNAWKQFDLLNAEQYIAYGTDLQQNADEPVPQRFSDLGEFANVETDWQDAMFQAAPIQDHNISILGGTEKATFNVGAGYFKQDGIMLGTGFDRISFRANTNFNLGRVTIGNTLTMAHTNRQVEPFSGGRSQIEHMIKSVPYLPIYDESRPGGFRAPDRVDGTDPENPVLNALLRENDDMNFKILGTAYATVDILEGLQYKFLVGLDMNYGSIRNFTPIFDAGDFSKNPTADLSETRSTFISPLISNQLNYSQTFGDHTVGATAVVERQTFTRTEVGGTGENTISDDIPVLGSVASPTVTGGKTEYALLSYIGRVNYDYADRYLLSASIRRDGGSRFSPGSKGLFRNKQYIQGLIV